MASEQKQDPEYLLAETGHEIERLQKQHRWLMRCSEGKIIWAPLDTKRENLKILDVGCADGTLIRDLQKQLPASAHLTGGDIMPSFLPTSPPPNTSFTTLDITKPFPAELQGAFDLTHVRYVMAGGAAVGVAGMLANLIASVRPGGWLQVYEMIDVAENRGPAASDLMAVLNALFKTLGMENYSANLEQAFKDAGLVNVRSERVEQRAGALWTDETAIRESIEPFKLTIPSVIGGAQKMGAEIPASVTDNLQERFEKEMTETGGSFWGVVVYGQKKEE